MINFGFEVSLGPLSIAKSEMLYAWRNDKSIYQWCRQFEPLETWTHYQWLDSLKTRKDVKMYSVVADSEVVGVCGLTSLDLINRHAEFSLYIAPEHHGKGLGEKALKTLCAHGFNALGLRHIFGETFDGNPAAKMFEKVGFQKEGTRRGFYFRGGRFIDAHLYSILSFEFSDKWKC